MKTMVTGLLLATGVIAGCSEKICSERGCQHGVTLDYSATRLPEGSYRFEVTSQEGSTTCKLQSLGNSSFDHQCSGELQVLAGLSELTVSGTPAEVSVHIYQDSELVAELSVEPEYSAFYPNGPSCEPMCQVDQIQVSLSAP